MERKHNQNNSAAWYHGSREDFLASKHDEIPNQLAARAADESLEVESNQSEEWRRSVDLLQRNLDERIPILRETLMSPSCEAIRDVILEFDFRRRGLRMDCLLLADGALFVIEFKRTKIDRADRDQVMNYSVNLLEFHKVTQDWCGNDKAIIIPIIALTDAKTASPPKWSGLDDCAWTSLAKKPLECCRDNLREALLIGLKNRRTKANVSRNQWIQSQFKPSSSILDATLSLYGNHDVVAIQEHAAPKAEIDRTTTEIKEVIQKSLKENRYHLIFLSGAPGAGKTLVGLDVVMRGNYADGAVFITGNAPLVEVLNEALRQSYANKGRRGSTWAVTGYRHTDAKYLASAATFKIVKAHNFLGTRGQSHQNADGRVLVFDEAQRTYEKGRIVLGNKLEDHEADLILKTQRATFPEGGAVVVALIGHNQAINRGERGMVAWLEAAVQNGWSYSISTNTLQLAQLDHDERWSSHPSRSPLAHGHLYQSLRYYRNAKVEEWVSAMLNGDADTASSLAEHLDANENTIWVTRNLPLAKRWTKNQSIGGLRCGIIASGQARRLAAEGLFVDQKPSIADWMLSPSTDIRSSNALETVQNQYQIQGLELDFCIVCWDADLRREKNKWSAFKLSGSDWKKDKFLDIAKNGYRVILTRARKGMVIFIPEGDKTDEDKTRSGEIYNQIFEYCIKCGAKSLIEN